MKKQTMHFFWAIGIALAISIAATSLGYGDASSQNKKPTVDAPTDSSIKEQLTDVSFVEKAAANILKDTELSKLALQKSENKKLRKFAQKIFDTSSASMGKLKQAASTYRFDVPTQLDDEQRRMIGQMQQLNGVEFDRTFAEVMKKELDLNVGLYDNAAGQGTLNVDLRLFAHQQLPTLRQNQKMAHALIQPAPAAADTKPAAVDTKRTTRNSANEG